MWGGVLPGEGADRADTKDWSSPLKALVLSDGVGVTRPRGMTIFSDGVGVVRDRGGGLILELSDGVGVALTRVAVTPSCWGVGVARVRGLRLAMCTGEVFLRMPKGRGRGMMSNVTGRSGVPCGVPCCSVALGLRGGGRITLGEGWR